MEGLLTKAPLKIGIIGAGAISVFHMKGWAAQSDVELISICDTNRDLAAARASEFGIEKVYSDAAEMFAQEAFDAVDIITPVKTHADLTRLAADHSVHVMCQKPMTPTVAEASKLIEDVGTRVRFMIHENYRWRPHYRRIAALLAAGAIGRPLHARMTVRSASMVASPGETPFLLARQPYLANFKRLLIFEVLIHHMDTLRSLLGELEVTYATTAKVNSALAGEDVAVISMTGADGITVLLDGNISAMGYGPLPGDFLEIVGTEDTLIFARDRIFLMSAPDEAEIQDMEANYQACFTGAITDFVQGLRTGAAFATDRLDNLQTLTLMENAYRAAGVPLDF